MNRVPVIITTAHLRQRADELALMADEEEAAGRVQSAMVRMIIANEFTALARTAESDENPGDETGQHAPVRRLT